MNTFRHPSSTVPQAFERLQLGFGRDLMERAEIARSRQLEAEEMQNAIYGDIGIGGAQGIISLICAMIDQRSHTREELIELGTAIGGPVVAVLLDEFLEQFEGTDPLHDIWHRTPDGHYCLTSGLDAQNGTGRHGGGSRTSTKRDLI